MSSSGAGNHADESAAGAGGDERVSRTVIKPRAGFRAELPGLDIATLLQMTCARRNRVVVRVTSELRAREPDQPATNEEGFIYSANGRIVHATLGSAVGEEAVLAMMSWVGGEFSIVDSPFPDRPSIDASTDELLVLAAQRADERAQRSTTPPPLPPTAATQRASAVPPVRHGLPPVSPRISFPPVVAPPQARTPAGAFPAARAPAGGAQRPDAQRTSGAHAQRESFAPPPRDSFAPPPARESFAPPARGSFAPPARDSFAPPARDSLAPPARDSLAPPVRDSFAPRSSRDSFAPTGRDSLSSPRDSFTPTTRNATVPGPHPSPRPSLPAALYQSYDEPGDDAPTLFPPAASRASVAPIDTRPGGHVSGSRASSHLPAYEDRPSLPPRRSKVPPPPPPVPARGSTIPNESLQHDSALIASVRVDSQGAVVGTFAGEGTGDLLPQLVAYVTRLITLVRADFSLDPFEALHAELSGMRIVLFEDAGETVGLMLRPGSAVQELRQRLGV